MTPRREGVDPIDRAGIAQEEAARLRAQYEALFRSKIGETKKQLKDKEGAKEIIGALIDTSVDYVETSIKSDGTLAATNALTSTLDATSEYDRINLKIQNNRGYDAFLTSLSIHGKIITKSSGASGCLISDKLKRDDDIRRNGEVVKEISNDYIFAAAQVDKLADHAYKNCGTKKHLYSIQIKGTALWYEVGEWYDISLGGAGRNEYISATVEIVSVDCQRTNGDIGTTSLLVHECMESWTKTTLYAARYVSGASPKRRTNQSNTVIVAASTFNGTYNDRCEGVDDDVKIQSAVDYLASIGGGTVQKTPGIYIFCGCYYEIKCKNCWKWSGYNRYSC